MAGFDPDAYLAEPPKAFDPDAYLQSLPEVEVIADRDEIPAPRSFGQRFGATTAGLADTVFGIVPQAIAETGYASVRAMESLGLAKPGQAQRGKEAFLREYGTPFGSTFGVTETPEYRGEASQQLMQFIGENVNKGADWISANTGIPKADVENLIFTSMFTLPAAYRGAKTSVQKTAPYVQEAVTAVAESAPGRTVLKPFQDRAAAKQEARVASSFENAAKIDAANLAVKHGIALNPAEANPTRANRLKASMAGAENLTENLSKINEPRFTQLALQDMNLPPNTVLNAKAFETALDQHSGPYNRIKEIPALVADDAVIAEIQSLRIERPSIGGEASAKAVNKLVDEAVAKIKAGRSGAEVIADIRKLRRDANAVYNAQQKSGVPDPVKIARAEANKKLADSLENLIEANVRDPKLLGELRKARAEMAKIYDYERATNFATNRIDPTVLAKMVEEGKPLSGIAADIGKIVAVFPNIAQQGKTGKPFWAPERLTRSTAAGTIGLAVGGLPGAIGGAVTGNIASGLAGRRMASPGYQAKYALPQDFRPPVVENNLRPATMSTDRNLPVPFDPRNALVTKNQIPNWVFGQAIPEGDVRVGVPSAPQLEAPSAASTMRGVEQRRRFDYERQRAEAEAAATQQAAGEAAGRRPTSGEVILELDPVTGKLRSTSQGIKGATLEVVEAPGKALRSAADKISAGQRFKLSAEEKVAWEKTRVDLAVVDSGLAKLSDKALAEKAMDRAWVAETVAKAKQKAAAFAEIEKRSKDAQQVARARRERERLMDALEALEPQLSRPRATSAGEQGPKTREAIRNKLAPSTDLPHFTGSGVNNLRK
jgi:hypothetical protein